MTTTDTGNGTPANDEVKQNQAAQETPQQETVKRKFGYIHLCQNCKGGHGDVYFTDGSFDPTHTFGDIDRVCKMMDDESAKEFRNDVTAHQARGKLWNLLSPEQQAQRQKERLEEQEAQRRIQREQEEYYAEQQRLAAMRKDLLEQMNNLQEKNDVLQIQGLSDHALAMVLNNAMTKALGSPKLANALREMVSRKMLVGISMTTVYDTDILNLDGGTEITNQVINPGNLMANDDVSEEQADLEEELAELVDKLKDLKRLERAMSQER